MHGMAPVAPPPLRFGSTQPLARKKGRTGFGAQSPARKKARTAACLQRAVQGAQPVKGAVQGSAQSGRQPKRCHAQPVKRAVQYSAQKQPLAFVSEAQHVEQHAGFKGFCICCDVQKRRKAYEACSLHNGVSWLSGRVSRGRRRLGCTPCAKFWAAGGKSVSSRFSKFVKFQVSPTSSWRAMWLIEQHHQAQSHRIGCGIARRKRNRKRRGTTSPRPCAQSLSFAQTLSCPELWPTEASLDRWNPQVYSGRERWNSQGQGDGPCRAQRHRACHEVPPVPP